MKRFQAYDDYEYGSHELLCESDNLMDCYNACLQRFEDTDGECDCYIRDYETTDSNYIGIYGWNDKV
jgi:hypothetical protein